LRKSIGIIILLILSSFLNAQDRGVIIREAVGQEAVVGKQWAVLIAIDRYKEWNPLSNPVRDAKEIRDILLDQYYIDEIRELYDQNATAAGIRQLLSSLRTEVARDDSVFVFYAGHGHSDTITNTGFWIPSDGGKDSMVQANWLPNIQVRNMLSALPAKHVFLVSDSCFSGDMLDVYRGSGPVIDNEYYRRAYSMVSRQVMTSGASETVPDASEFAMRLKSSLRRAEGACIDPQYLFTIVREVKSTQPMLGSIRDSEHQAGGTFLFFRKQTASIAQSSTAALAAPHPSISVSVGTITIVSEYAGIILLDGEETGSRIKAGGTMTITNVLTGATEVAIKTDDGSITKAQGTVMVQEGKTAQVTIGKPVLITVKQRSEPNPASYLWTVGASIGSTFADPWLVGTVQGTIAPLRNSFIGIGVDFGLVSGMEDVGYYSFYPFVHLAFFMPFAKKGGWYAGAGGGYLFSRYDFSGTKYSLNLFAADAFAGVNLFNMLDISYTLRTNFDVANHKFAVGYTYRFK